MRRVVYHARDRAEVGTPRPRSKLEVTTRVARTTVRLVRRSVTSPVGHATADDDVTWLSCIWQ